MELITDNKSFHKNCDDKGATSRIAKAGGLTQVILRCDPVIHIIGEYLTEVGGWYIENYRS